MTDQEHSKTHKTLCYVDRPLGWLADLATRGAQHCYCCSFYRGILVGAVVAGIAVGEFV